MMQLPLGWSLVRIKLSMVVGEADIGGEVEVHLSWGSVEVCLATQEAGGLMKARDQLPCG